MKRLIALAVLMGISFFVNAEEPDNTNSAEKYYGYTGAAVTLCQLTFMSAQSMAAMGKPQDEKSDYVGCIKEKKAEAKAYFITAVRAVKKPKAQEALKSYQVAAIAALDGIRPGVEEIRLDYDRRQQVLKDKLDEAWTRFEIEQDVDTNAK